MLKTTAVLLIESFKALTDLFLEGESNPVPEGLDISFSYDDGSGALACYTGPVREMNYEFKRNNKTYFVFFYSGENAFDPSYEIGINIQEGSKIRGQSFISDFDGLHISDEDRFEEDVKEVLSSLREIVTEWRP